ncbi:MAG: fumarylacetoacetate hydrolase family protein [Candidatus Caldarchaeum sp.]|nr:fumarylacetoacetate hydrolase family protein [Candidatus Caldarchaeum sp.]MDW8062929.1 fumarylacetoacetate hydrolase family protein [Candidatus Caldarchaeum sp.]MDW8435195.1 fumarylacetoacetate hydrolase family protein [Candidatus Caldarchaeum sp.]
MKLVSFSSDHLTKIGLVTEYGILDLPAVYGLVYGDETVPSWLTSMRSLLSAGEDGMNFVAKLEKEARSFGLDKRLYRSLSATALKPPVPDARKILCVAANYVAHSEEMKMKVPEKPYFFTKFANTLVGHEGEIIIPKSSHQVDYEIELAVVIGKRGKYIDRRKAYDYVAGYTVFNDVSFRDKQFPPGWPQQLNPFGQNWVLGKGLDNAAPCGPYLVTKDEIGSPYPLQLILKVNGEVRQNGSTKDMYFKIDELVEYVSDGLTLEPGDIIATGTPPGVAAAGGGRFLNEGDVVEAEIEKIGLLRNTVVRDRY